MKLSALLISALIVGLCVAATTVSARRVLHPNSASTSSASGAYPFPFFDPSLSWKDRVADLVSRLTLKEKCDNMAYGGAAANSPTPPIDRLQIKPYQWGTECLSGDVVAGRATAFPEAIGMAAIFDDKSVFDMAKATADEVRAKHNDYASRGDYSFHTGLSCWSPVLNIARHPLWGRNQETYGECPFLTGELATAYVQGLQGNNDRYVLANAGCKHYAVHNGPEDKPVGRFSFNAVVSETDIYQTFLPAFEKCVKAGTYSIMCSFNAVNGVPACANHFLLTEVLRNEWGFEGYVVSDQGALEYMFTEHHYTKSWPETAAAAANAGCCLEDADQHDGIAFTYLEQAVQLGLLNVSVIDDAVSRLFMTRMRLGEFDPPEMNPYNKLNLSVVMSPEHVQLAQTLAENSFVLMKNDRSFLPLQASKWQGSTVAIVGPFADRADLLYGDYAPDVNLSVVVTPRAALTAKWSALGGQAQFAAACNDSKCVSVDYTGVSQAVAGANIIFAFLGTGAMLESEADDRANIDLPGEQLNLLKFLVGQGKPVVVVLYNAGALDVSYAKSNPIVQSMIECFYPAQTAGSALVRVLFGDVNPAARLPTTWPQSISQCASITNYSMEGSCTFRYMKGVPLYPFGYGLSYTTFQYSNLVIATPQIHAGQGQTVTVTVTNTGSRDGDEVVQVYFSFVHASTPSVPIRDLAGFRRVTIGAGRSVTVTIPIDAQRFQLYNENIHGFYTPQTAVNVFVGGQQPGQETTVGSNVLTGSFSIV